MMYAVIGNTNRSNEPCLFCFDERTPGAIAGLFTTVWGMDEVSVRSEMLDAKLFVKTLLESEHPVSPRPSISQFAGYLTNWSAIRTDLSSQAAWSGHFSKPLEWPDMSNALLDLIIVCI